MRHSLALLDDARRLKASRSTTSEELWQLQLIVSDGLCQEHAAVQTLVRKASDRNIMVVFIIIDSLAQRNSETHREDKKGADGIRDSILTLTTASYEMGGDGGSDGMQLRIDRYIDTFPFPHYLVLRDIHALPSAISAILKQFLDRFQAR